MARDERGRRDLPVSEVAVKTATVEVKVLRVSGRQMTQAVFRQLHDEGLIDPVSLTLRGEPWGLVNYHAGCSVYELGSHVHVVWQKDGQLRKACHCRNPVDDWGAGRRVNGLLMEWEDAMQAYLWACGLEGLPIHVKRKHGGYLEVAPDWPGKESRGPSSIKIAPDFELLLAQYRESLAKPPVRWWLEHDGDEKRTQGTWNEPYIRAIREAEASLRDRIAAITGPGLTARQLEAQFVAPAEQALNDFWHGWIRCYQELLAQLDQLFIAV